MNWKDKLSSLREEIIESIKKNLDLDFIICDDINYLADWADSLEREAAIKEHIQRQEEESHYKE